MSNSNIHILVEKDDGLVVWSGESASISIDDSFDMSVRKYSIPTQTCTIAATKFMTKDTSPELISLSDSTLKRIVDYNYNTEHQQLKQQFEKLKEENESLKTQIEGRKEELEHFTDEIERCREAISNIYAHYPIVAAEVANILGDFDGAYFWAEKQKHFDGDIANIDSSNTEWKGEITW